jgi:hypothetical protein
MHGVEHLPHKRRKSECKECGSILRGVEHLPPQAHQEPVQGMRGVPGVEHLPPQAREEPVQGLSPQCPVRMDRWQRGAGNPREARLARRPCQDQSLVTLPRPLTTIMTFLTLIVAGLPLSIIKKSSIHSRGSG